MSVHREQIIQAALQDVEMNTPVRTSDGAELGLVKEIAGDFITVDAPLRADYWINAEYVLSGGAEGVELSFAKGDLGAYKRDKPGLVDDEDPLSSEAAVDLVIDEDEQIEQRVRMERQLAEQRRDLPHTHPDGKGAPPDTGGTVGEPVEAELDRLDHGSALVHDDDEAPEFMTKLDARAIVGLEADSPLVAPVQSAMPAGGAAWGAHEPGERSAETVPSPIRRVWMMGAGLAILLGVGFGGYTVRRRAKHRRSFRS